MSLQYFCRPHYKLHPCCRIFKRNSEPITQYTIIAWVLWNFDYSTTPLWVYTGLGLCPIGRHHLWCFSNSFPFSGQSRGSKGAFDLPNGHCRTDHNASWPSTQANPKHRNIRLNYGIWSFFNAAQLISNFSLCASASHAASPICLFSTHRSTVFGLGNLQYLAKWLGHAGLRLSNNFRVWLCIFAPLAPYTATSNFRGARLAKR